jgi:glucoamylase
VLSHFDPARKDCLGTARNTTSKVWFTVANGVLSDVYYPTVDNTNVETLQYVVTDGSTFTDLQMRDMTSTARALDASGMTCEVTSTPTDGRYQIVTDYVADPARNALLMHVTFTVDKSVKKAGGDLRLYLRFDPTVNGNGGGDTGNGGADSATTDTSTGHTILVASDPNTSTNAVNRGYAQPVYAALDAPFAEATNGFAGAGSDGLTQLDASHTLTTSYTSASSGNVVQTARIAGSGDRSFTVSLGFGSSQSAAVQTAEGSLGSSFGKTLDASTKGWAGYDKALNAPPNTLPGITQKRVSNLRSSYFVSANVLKASEDKTFPGAIVASMTSPWGQAISAGDPANTYFGSYREVFARDLYEIWTGLMADGDRATARDATLFLFDRQQQADGSMPRNSLVNGKTAPDSFGTQLDETSYPLLMADQLHLTDAALYANHIKPAANFVASHGPAFGAERWEEQSGYSPSTIAAEIAGLVAAADLADTNPDAISAAVWRGVADDYQRSIKGWTVTTNGPLAARYFIRLSKSGDPNAAITYNVGNGGPTLDQRSVIDAGFLERPRSGFFWPHDSDILASLPVVDSTIGATTTSGPGWHRYNGDGYGDRSSDGRPWAPSGVGTGHLWPALSSERAEQSLQTGDAAGAAALLEGMDRFGGGVGLIPEQDWASPSLAASPFGTPPDTASIGFVNGEPAGSAGPLNWSAASFVRLFADIGAGSLGDRPRSTFQRYIAHTQTSTSLSVTSPADQSAVNGSPVTVTGTAVAGAAVYVTATNTDTSFATTGASTTADAGGAFSVAVAVTGGTTVLNVVAVSPSGGTAHVQRSVVFDFVPGTKLLDVTDPTGDDNGPGNYAYPTSSNFQPGAFDLEEFQVFDDGTNVIFRVKTRDLTPTFGNPLGAQLVDVYVHDPGAASGSTSTAAANGSRNFQIAPAFAWSRLIQVQGFGQRYENAAGTPLGTVAISANQISHFITFRVPKVSLGQPGTGWAFTVVLTGQDGFSGDQARGFQTVPKEFQFGVCAAVSVDPHCTVDPGTVPKAIDVIPPTGVLQSDELDYTVHNPVVLQGVTIP